MGDQPTSAIPARRHNQTYPLKWHLLLLALGTLLPALFFAVFVVDRLAQEEQRRSQYRLRQASQSLARAVDRELSSTVRTLQALSESRWLDDGDMPSFHRQISRVVKT